jgi:alanine racemase
MSTNAPSRAIIDLSAYAHNFEAVRQIIGEGIGIYAVVKANAYGHGLAPMAKKAISSGVERLAVAMVDEGVALREAGVEAPILVLLQPEESALDAILEYRLTPMVSSVAIALKLGERAQRANRVVQVHCKIDSGMGRQGFSLNAAAEELQRLTRISHLDIEGIATHFPAADESEDTYTYDQIKAFKHVLRRLDANGIPYELAHAANSAAIVNYHGSLFDFVRPGLMTYGVWPCKTPPPNPDLLRPVLRWETRVNQVRDIEAGASVGYGRTFTTSRRMRAAVLPIGYADGYKISLSNRAEVLLHGKRCRVRGSVCMDQIVVDVTHLENVQPGDVATIIGQDGDACITAQELADHAGTIPYDILTGIGARVPREYIG